MCYDIYGDYMKNKLNKMFGITKNNSSIKVEVFAGIATFLATAYILIANPNNLLMNGTLDPRWASVFIATALGAAIGTFLMGLYAKMPLVQAPGMGINALVGGIIGGTIGIVKVLNIQNYIVEHFRLVDTYNLIQNTFNLLVQIVITDFL